VTATVFLALIFALLLGIEWRYRIKGARIGAAILTLIVLQFAQPGYRRAARRALELQPSQRITQLGTAPPVSDYTSGVLSMERATIDDALIGEPARFLAVAVLFWLACTPLFRRAAAPDMMSASRNTNESA
jgi:hypothetical protein